MVFLKAGYRLLSGFIVVAASIGSVTAPSAGFAASPNGYPVSNVNLRAGPGTDYPVIVTVPARAPISILGCLADYAWCDTIFEGNRGWMRSIYLSGYYQGYYYSLRDYAPRLGYRIVTFDLNGYWSANYRDRPFYDEQSRWTVPHEDGYVDTAVFYDRLSPYGDWTWLQGQYVWVPSGVDQSWRPYTVGRWVYTDRGWTWVSNEPFGWATYHYGRWGFSNRVGWFWVPGRRWAPAWVTWRSSDDYLAWAPLPPTPDEAASFNVTVDTPVPDYYWQVVPSREFQSDDLSQRLVRDRSHPIIERTQPLGGVTVNNNNVVVNNSVTVNYVEQKTEQKVLTRKIALEKDPKGTKIEGDTIEVYQPAAEEKPKDLAPPKPKKIEEVAKQSQTKQQAGSEAATDEMLVPAEIKKATGETQGNSAVGEASKQGGRGATPLPAEPLAPSLPAGKEVSAPPPEVGASVSEPAPAGQAVPPPPPASGEPPPSVKGEQALPPPPSGGAASAPVKHEDSPTGPEQGGTEIKKGKGGKSKQGEPKFAEPSTPSSPAEESSPPPPVNQVVPPLPPAGNAAQPLSPPQTGEVPTPPPAAALPPNDSGEPKAKKHEKEQVQPEEIPSMEQSVPQAPSQHPAEDAGPPHAKKYRKPQEETPSIEAAPSPPPPEAGGSPKVNQKSKQEMTPAAQGSSVPSSSEHPPSAADGNASRNPTKAKGNQKAKPCPKGTVLQQDGSCAPPSQ